MSNSTTEMTLESLRSVPLFASLDDHEATELRSLLTSRQVNSGKQLFHKGDSGDACLIESGRLRISIRDLGGKEVTLAELAQGDFFGEMALIRRPIRCQLHTDSSSRNAGADNHDVAEPPARKDQLRADLDCHVNLKNELSLTEVLRRLDVLETERACQNYSTNRIC